MTVTLVGKDGVQIGYCRVPTVPHLPRVLLWGTRYFVLRSKSYDYAEATCHMVPLEHMHATPSPKQAPPRG